MFPNLRAEMARLNVTITKLSQLTKIPYSTLAPKLRGDKKLNLDEALVIQEALGLSIPLEVLFKHED